MKAKTVLVSGQEFGAETLMKAKGVWNSERKYSPEILQLVEHQLKIGADPSRIAHSLAGLKSLQAFGLASNFTIKRLETILIELPRQIIQQTAKRQQKLEHLFRGKTGVDPTRVQYRKLLKELEELMETEGFQVFSKHRQNTQVLEEQARVLSIQLAGTIDQYDFMNVETSIFNKLILNLYPNDYKSLRLDAHHIIEDRTYHKFKNEWHLLGWESGNDMPTIPLFYEYHIRSPKRLAGIETLGSKLDCKSLTQELLHTIKLEKIENPLQLLQEYAQYYSKTPIWKDVRPVLEAVDRELTIRKTTGRLVKGLKAASNR